MMERDIVKAIREYLHSLGAVTIKYHGGPYAQVGVSDIIFVLNGRAGFLEAKVPGKHATPVQLSFIDSCLRAGAIAGVVHSVDEVKELLNDLSPTVQK